MQNKKFLFAAFCLIILILVPAVATCQQSSRLLEVTYPAVNGYRPTTSRTPLPDFVKYVFNFGLMISALVIFGVLVYAGIRYVTSVGNPSAAKDAQQQIFSAVLGLAVLLAAYLILTTINPELIRLQAIREATTKGLIIFKSKVCQINAPEDPVIPCQNAGDCSGRPCNACGGVGAPSGSSAWSTGDAYPEWVYDKLAGQNLAMKIKSSMPSLTGFLETGEHLDDFLFFYETTNDLRILFFNHPNWETPPGSSILELRVDNPNICASSASIGGGFDVQSIQLVPRLLGAYLCNKPFTFSAAINQYICGTETDPGLEFFFAKSTNVVPTDIHDKSQGLYIRNKASVCNTALGDPTVPCRSDSDCPSGISCNFQPQNAVILHRDSNFQGGAELFLDSEPNLDARINGGTFTTGDIKSNEASSITVFQLAASASGKVTFYEGENYTGNYYECTTETAPTGGTCTAFNADGSPAGVSIEVPRCNRAIHAMSGIDYSLCAPNLPDGATNGLPPNDKINSIAVGGNYAVIMFSEAQFRVPPGSVGVETEGFAEVFLDSDKNLTDNPLGRCGSWIMGQKACTSSFIIMPVRY